MIRHAPKLWSGTEGLKEDIPALGSVKRRHAKAAQQQIISVKRQLEAEGTIHRNGSVGEQYGV